MIKQIIKKILIVIFGICIVVFIVYLSEKYIGNNEVRTSLEYDFASENEEDETVLVENEEQSKGIKKLDHDSKEFIRIKKNVDMINRLNRHNAELRAVNNAKTEMYLKNGYNNENIDDAIKIFEKALIYHSDNKSIKKALKKARKDFKKIKR